MTARIGHWLIAGAAAVLLFGGPGASLAQAQRTGTIQGIILDATPQRPLASARVVVQGTDLGAITNDQGRYQIRGVPIGVHTLEIELLGYTTTTRRVEVAEGQTVTANVAIEQTAVMLQGLVVTGVSGGAIEQLKVPFSVERMDVSQMPVPNVNPLSQFQGKGAGANIASISGRPGVAPAVILRGPTSINGEDRGQEPLYVVDGIVLSSGIADLNPADIESVEIVKGAAASTLFGSRAAAGVISITTKRASGFQDQVSFNVRSEVGFNDIERDFGIARYHTYLLDVTGTRFCVQDGLADRNFVCSRTVDYRAEQKRVNDVPGDFALTPVGFPVDLGATTQGDILRRAFLATKWPGKMYNAVAQLVVPKPFVTNDVSMMGRMGSTSFFTSVGHTRHAGAVQGLDGYERLSGRVNVTHRIGDDWSVDVSSFFSRATLDGTDQEEGGTGWFRLTRTPAIVDITQRDSYGRLYIRTNLSGQGGTQNENPLYSFENRDREDVRWRILAGTTVRYTPLPWLEADANFNLDRLNLNFKQFHNRGFRSTNPNPGTNNGLIFNGTNNTQSINASVGGTVRPQLLDRLHSRFTARWLFEQEDIDNRDFIGQFLRVKDVQSGENSTQNQQISSERMRTRQMSFAGGAFFDLMDRYEFDFAVRHDGNSRFGAGRRWQTYGRASGAWLVSREPWFPEGRVSALKLRASYGTAGQAPNYVAQYETYEIGSGGSLSPQTLGNPELRPEVSREVEFGGDIQLFNRVDVSLTYANALTDNQILPVPTSVATGFPQQWQNAGALRSKTWEASLTVPILTNPEGLRWTARANYARNRTVIERLDVQPFLIGTDLQATGEIIRIEEGLRYGTIVGRRFMRSCKELPVEFQSQCGGPTSAFQKNDEGWLVWVGEGNNPRMGITHNLWNAVLPASQAPYGVQLGWGLPILIRNPETGSPELGPVGHALPDYRIGISQTLEYKNFSLYALVEGAFGQSVWNQGKHWSYLDFLSHELDQGNKSVEQAKPIGYYYRAGSGPGGGSGIGGFYDILTPNNRTTEDASVVKLREVALSYRLGRVASFGDWTLTLVGRNLKTWTDYSGFDPEVGIGSSGGAAGSGLINAIDAFTFPQPRTVSFAISTRF